MDLKFQFLLGFVITLVIGATITINRDSPSEEIPPLQETVDIDTLQQVHVIFRHGDRTPFEGAIPNDPYGNISFWPIGWGQLTEIGEESHFQLGKFLRSRYADFLKDKSECFVQSSDIDRAITSAEANLAGLFPPKKSTKHWSQKYKMNWQPVPVHVINAKLDNKINFVADCPKYKMLLQNTLNSPFVSEINAKNKKLYNHLTKHTGRTVLDFTAVADIFDTLFVQKAHGLTLPDWAHEIYDTQMKPLAILPFKILNFDEDMTRLRGGPLLNEIIDHMEVAMDKSKLNTLQFKNQTSAKFYMYSGHDTTVSTILSALKIYDNNHIPPYCSMVMIELHKMNAGNYFINVFYRNSTDIPIQMKIPECTAEKSDKCFFENFKTALSRHQISQQDWEFECALMKSENMLNGLQEFAGDIAKTIFSLFD